MCYLQKYGHVLDCAVVAGGNELRFEVLITEAVHLSRLCPYKELLALSSESNGGHALIQLDFPDVGEEKEKKKEHQFYYKGNLDIFLIYKTEGNKL